MTAEQGVCAITSSVFVAVAEAESLAICLDLGAVRDVGCTTRSEGLWNGPATLSPTIVSHGES